MVSIDKDKSQTPPMILVPNMAYLIKYNLFLALLCAPAGFALVGNNQVSPIIAAKLDWDKD